MIVSASNVKRGQLFGTLAAKAGGYPLSLAVADAEVRTGSSELDTDFVSILVARRTSVSGDMGVQTFLVDASDELWVED